MSGFNTINKEYIRDVLKPSIIDYIFKYSVSCCWISAIMAILNQEPFKVALLAREAP